MIGGNHSLPHECFCFASFSPSPLRSRWHIRSPSSFIPTRKETKEERRKKRKRVWIKRCGEGSISIHIRVLLQLSLYSRCFGQYMNTFYLQFSYAFICICWGRHMYMIMFQPLMRFFILFWSTFACDFVSSSAMPSFVSALDIYIYTWSDIPDLNLFWIIYIYIWSYFQLWNPLFAYVLVNIYIYTRSCFQLSYNLVAFARMHIHMWSCFQFRTSDVVPFASVLVHVYMSSHCQSVYICLGSYIYVYDQICNCISCNSFEPTHAHGQVSSSVVAYFTFVWVYMYVSSPIRPCLVHFYFGSTDI